MGVKHFLKLQEELLDPGCVNVKSDTVRAFTKTFWIFFVDLRKRIHQWVLLIFPIFLDFLGINSGSKMN